jgi:hypothetical protein
VHFATRDCHQFDFENPSFGIKIQPELLLEVWHINSALCWGLVTPFKLAT